MLLDMSKDIAGEHYQSSADAAFALRDLQC